MSRRPTLVAVLIVRDESAVLADCLASLTPVVDEIHVHDTGSTDDTLSIARTSGAVVTQGPWQDDFAAARNEALTAVNSEWVLSLDADERVVADAVALRALLAHTSDPAVTIDIDNAHDEAPYTHAATRLFRPDRLQWEGRVHERLVGPAFRAGHALREVIRLDHLGYRSAEVRVSKSLRNADLAQADLDALVARGADPSTLAQTLLDLARSKVGAQQLQDAVDTYESLRELFPGTPEALQGTDGFARLLLGAGMDEAALALVDELRAGGASSSYCDWLAAQAVAQLGDVATAARLLDGVREVVDVAGRRYDPAQLTALKRLMAELVRVSGTD